MGVVSLVSVYAPTEASDLTVKDAFYATLESVVDLCPRRDALLVLGDFIASNGTDRNGYDMYVGPHGSGTVNQNSTKFLAFINYGLIKVLIRPKLGISLNIACRAKKTNFDFRPM